MQDNWQDLSEPVFPGKKISPLESCFEDNMRHWGYKHESGVGGGGIKKWTWVSKTPGRLEQLPVIQSQALKLRPNERFEDAEEAVSRRQEQGAGGLILLGTTGTRSRMNQQSQFQQHPRQPCLGSRETESGGITPSPFWGLTGCLPGSFVGRIFTNF